MDNVFISLPFPVADLDELSQLIGDAGGIVAATDALSAGSWQAIAEDLALRGTRFTAHVDSDFVVRLLRLHSGRVIRLTNEDLAVAALMALAIGFDMQVNPTHAIHEYACTAEGDSEERLARFYFANNVDPNMYVNIALRRRGTLAKPSPSELKQFCKWRRRDLEMPIQGYGINYMGLKNMLGTFYPASEIHIFPEVLRSLPEREYRSGLAEVINTALLGEETVVSVLRDERTVALEREVVLQASKHGRVVFDDQDGLTGHGLRPLLP